MENGLIQKIRISSVRMETAQTRTLFLEPVGGWQPVSRSGQFITLVFQTRLGEQRRSYSISSSPELGEPLSITVKKIDNGEFSRWLVYKATPGDVLQTSGIGGFFTLPQNTSNKTFVFLAAGSGITPCFSLIKTILETSEQNVFLFYSNRNEYDTIFLKELEQMQEAFSERLHIHFLYSYKMDVYKSRLSHWLLSHFVQKHFSTYEKPKLLFYLCGPFDYMRMCSISLRNNGFSPTQIIKEDFNPMPPIIKELPPDTDPHKVNIQIGRRHFSLMVQYPNSIVATAKAAKISLPYSCETGRCGSCVATCTSGKIWMAYNEVLTDEEIAKGRVLTCQSFPVGGDVEVQF